MGAVPAASALEAGTLLQGDLLTGLAAAVSGLGGVPELPAEQRLRAGDDDVWTVTFLAPSGYYALCSQDCDVAGDDAAEPTVLVAPVVWLPLERWRIASAGGYLSRFFALPDSGQAPEGYGAAVDLAWMTSIAKGSLRHDAVGVARTLTGPQQRQFAAWVGWRFARVPFPDDVVRCVLDPAYDVRSRLLSRYGSARSRDQTLPADTRTVAACVAWYARLTSPNVTMLGRLTTDALFAAGFVDDDGAIDGDELERGRVKLEAAIRKRMQRVEPNSGFGIKVILRTFDQLRASDLDTFSLLTR